MSEPDLILADIIATEMKLDRDRVVIYNQNYKPPKDPDIYIIIALQFSRVIGNNNRFNPDTDEEEQYVSVSETYNVEITSKNRDAMTNRFGVNLAIKSTYSQQKQEENNIRIFRTNQNMDLSFIEGTSSLQRYRIPVIINSTQLENKAIDYYDKYKAIEEATE